MAEPEDRGPLLRDFLREAAEAVAKSVSISVPSLGVDLARFTRALWDFYRSRGTRYSVETGTANKSKALPELPVQGVGPHFQLGENGLLNFVPSSDLDEAGNNGKLLNDLQPVLQDLVQQLLAELGGGNSPHHALRERVRDYQALISQPLDQINFGRLYVEGVRYLNALNAATTSDDLPPLDATAKERADSLSQLHGVFILATVDGAQAVEAEMRYRRLPSEEEAFRHDMVEVAQTMAAHPEVVAPEVANFLVEAASETGKGPNPARSSTAATGSIRNAAIVISYGAVIAAIPLAAGAALGVGGALGASAIVLLANEAVKKSKPFEAIRDNLTETINWASHKGLNELAEKLRPHLELMRILRPRLQAVAEKDESFSWVNSTGDFLEGSSSAIAATDLGDREELIKAISNILSLPIPYNYAYAQIRALSKTRVRDDQVRTLFDMKGGSQINDIAGDILIQLPDDTTFRIERDDNCSVRVMIVHIFDKDT